MSNASDLCLTNSVRILTPKNFKRRMQRADSLFMVMFVTEYWQHRHGPLPIYLFI